MSKKPVKKTPAKKEPAKKTKAGDPFKATIRSKSSKKVAPKRANPFLAYKKSAKTRWAESMTVGSDIETTDTPRISTGNFGLDIATYGGIPRGRVSCFYGLPRSTKTGSCLNVVVEWQKHCCFCFNRGPCDCAGRGPAGVLWVDAEGKLADSLMKPWMEGHGVDLDAVLFERPDSGEEIIDAVDDAIRQGVGLIVIDSIAHMVTKEEIVKAAEDGTLPGRGALLVNKAMRRWVVAMTQRGFNESGTIPTVLIINQIRGTFDKYNPEVTPGGKGKDFAMSLGVRFFSSKGRRRYRITKEDGSFKDVKIPPGPDVSPNYQDTDYKVTDSSMCPPGRYGSYNYWVKAGHGRRKGDPDNAAQLVRYLDRYNWIISGKGGYHIKVPEDWVVEADEVDPWLIAKKKLGPGGIIDLFRFDTELQERVWRVMIRQLVTNEG